MSSYVYNQSHNKQSDINQVTIGAMGDHCFGRGGAGGFRVFSLSLRGACRISHLVVPKQQNGSPNQQMVVHKQQNESPNQQMLTPFQQNGYPRNYWYWDYLHGPSEHPRRNVSCRCHHGRWRWNRRPRFHLQAEQWQKKRDMLACWHQQHLLKNGSLDGSFKFVL